MAPAADSGLVSHAVEDDSLDKAGRWNAQVCKSAAWRSASWAACLPGMVACCAAGLPSCCAQRPAVHSVWLLLLVVQQTWHAHACFVGSTSSSSSRTLPPCSRLPCSCTLRSSSPWQPGLLASALCGGCNRVELLQGGDCQAHQLLQQADRLLSDDAKLSAQI